MYISQIYKSTLSGRTDIASLLLSPLMGLFAVPCCGSSLSSIRLSRSTLSSKNSREEKNLPFCSCCRGCFGLSAEGFLLHSGRVSSE